MSLAFWYYLIAISESLRDMFTTASRLSLGAVILCAFLLGLKIAFSLDNDLSTYLADKTSPLSLAFSKVPKILKISVFVIILSNVLYVVVPKKQDLIIISGLAVGENIVREIGKSELANKLYLVVNKQLDSILEKDQSKEKKEQPKAASTAPNAASAAPNAASAAQ